MGTNSYKHMLELDRLFRHGRRFRLRDIAERLCVSERTVQRYITTIKKDFKAPVAYETGSKSFYYEKPSYNLPSLSFSENELTAILLAERALRQYVKTPFNPSHERDQDSLHKTFNKLISLLPEGQGVPHFVAAVCGAVSFQNPYPVAHIDIQIFSELMKAVVEKKLTSLTYNLIGSNIQAIINVEPYHLANWGGDWFLIAYSHEKKTVKNYHVSRIAEVKMLERHFSPPRDFDPEKYMVSVFGQMKAAQREVVKVRILPPTSRWVKERDWRFVESITEEKDGSIILEMRVVANDAVKTWVMQFGSQAELLEPAGMRETIRKELEEAAGKYA